MIKPTSTARKIANRYRARIRAMDAGLRKLVRRAAISINSAAEDNLAGSNAAAPGSYPVPNRTGNLLRSQGWRVVNKYTGFVMNTAGYANAIHAGKSGTEDVGGHVRTTDRVFKHKLAGKIAYKVGSYKRKVNTESRPFLDDAVEETPYLEEMRQGYRRLVLEGSGTLGDV